MGVSLAWRRFKIASRLSQPRKLATAGRFSGYCWRGVAVDSGLVFGILGPLEVRLGGSLVPIGGPRQRALLALLLCHANRVVSRDQLVDELLGDQPAGSAERMLRVQISRLRKALADGGGRPRVLARPPGYLLRVEPGE